MKKQIKQKENKTRLYRFYNFVVGEYGEPFARCDRHTKNYKSPPDCIVEMIASTTKWRCGLCENNIPFEPGEIK